MSKRRRLRAALGAKELFKGSRGNSLGSRAHRASHKSRDASTHRGGNQRGAA